MNKKDALKILDVIFVKDDDYKKIPKEFWSDKDFVLEAVKKKGLALQFAHESLKKDKSIVLEAVKQNGFALEFADESLKKDPDIIKAAEKKEKR